MLGVRLGWRGTTAGAIRAAWRQGQMLPAAPLAALQARQWQIGRDGIDGYYLFDDDAEAVDAFLARPKADPACALLAAALGSMRGDPPRVEAVPAAARVRRPVFIIAAPRSGSTWLIDMLSQAPGVWTQGAEGQGVVDGIASLHPSRRGWVSDRLVADNLTPTTEACLHASWRFGLRDRDGHVNPPDAMRLLDKTTEHVLRVGFLSRACPDAQFVFLHRDARQNISSLIKAWRHGGFVRFAEVPGWHFGDWCFLLPPDWQALRGRSLQEVATAQWQAATHWALHDLEMLDRARWTSVDYNELVAHPRTVVERLCSFLGLAVDSRFDAFLARPPSVSATAIDPPSVVKWRSHAELDARLVEDATRSTSARLRSLRASPAESGHAAVPTARERSDVRFICPLPEVDTRPEELGAELVIDPSLRVQVGASIPLGLAARTRFRERFAADQPILWSRDALTRSWLPYWAPRHLVRQLVELESGGPLQSSAERLRASLRKAGLAATAEKRMQAQSRAGEVRRLARTAFAAQGFCVVPDVLPADHMQALARYYRALVAGGRWEIGDEQVARRHGWHNESVGRFFHHQLSDFVGELVGEKVCPSYCYVSAYQQGAELAPHIDRKQCKYTFSIVFDESGGRSVDWPLWFLAAAEPSAVTLELGQGVLFLGHELPHWREAPPVESLALSTLLLHYVATDFTETLN